MKKILQFALLLFLSLPLKAQTTCDSSGNVVLFSNYDGGVLDINVDVNIPNLKIGVVSYEMVTINLTGPFVNNVSAVQFAGYTTTTHQHCTNTPLVTSIAGAPPGTDTIIFMPNSPLSNPNGYYIIICNTSCDTLTNQGGCNTPDQVAAYFQQQFGGTLRYQYTQYGCWSGTYNLSSGGNCCVGAVAPVPLPITGFQSSDTSFCDKKCLDFTDLSTNNPTSWQWLFPGADSTSSSLQNPTGICYSSYGSFDVTLIACNSFGCDTLFMPGFINEFQPPPPPVISANADTLFSTNGFAYQWCDSTGPIPGAVNAYYVFLQQGIYYVIVTDSNGCATSSAIVNTGIDDNGRHNPFFQIFPNPSNGNFRFEKLSGFNGSVKLEIVDINSKIVYGSFIRDNSVLVRMTNVLSGIYFIKVTTEKEIYHYKLVIQNSN